MGRIIAVAILKGGTAKTTTTLNLGAALAERGLRVLLIDNDHQCSLTRALGVEPTEVELERTLFGAMQHFITTRQPALDQAIVALAGGIDLVPASIRLSRMDKELQLTPRREYVLQELLAPVAPLYDVVLIDTMPTNNNLVINALVAAHEVLIPLEPEKLAVDSLMLTLEDVTQIRETGLNRQLQISGVLFTHVDTRLVLHKDLMEAIRKEFGDEVPIFEAMIRHSVRFPESQVRQQSIIQYDPRGNGAAAYRALAEELIHAWQ